jgi:hypothetical protein
MKNNFYKNIFLYLIPVALFSCGQENVESTETATTTETVIEEIIKGNYALDANTSSATWDRVLDQKPTKQKVKLFGSMVDVELGAVKLNTNGTVILTGGELLTSNDEITNATAIFDMASLKFAKEKGSGLFDAEKYPNSTLEIFNIEPTDSTGYHSEGNLTIQEVTNKVSLSLDVIKSENNYTLKGSFTINTLDFPLRDKVTEKDINKDEITINFELNYSVNS